MKLSEVYKCDVCGAELTENGYPLAWEHIHRTHVQSYSTWEGYNKEEHICSNCYSALGNNSERKTLKDRISDLCKARKNCEKAEEEHRNEILKLECLQRQYVVVSNLIESGVLKIINSKCVLDLSRADELGMPVQINQDMVADFYIRDEIMNHRHNEI